MRGIPWHGSGLLVPVLAVGLLLATDPIDLRSPLAASSNPLQDGDSFFWEISRELLRVAASEGDGPPVPLEGQGRSAPESPLVDFEPPPGALHHSNDDNGGSVKVPVQRRKRWTRKDAREGEEGTQPRDSWYQLGFSSARYVPLPGLGTRMAEEATKPGRPGIYGFLLIDEFLTPDLVAELKAQGVALLGAHSTAQKVRVPRDPQRLEAIVQLPYVSWLGFAESRQKLSKDLALSVAESSLNEFPVVINLFERDSRDLFRQEIEKTGVAVAGYDADLVALRGVATRTAIEALVEMDFVLFIELVQPTFAYHSQSTALIGADYIRPGPGVTSGRYSGSSTILGIMDSGFMVSSAAATMHQDLNKFACGSNFTTDAAGPFNDQNGHGTHVLATISRGWHGR